MLPWQKLPKSCGLRYNKSIMGKGFIAFLIAISLSTWIYGKFMRSTGGNTQNSIIAVVIIGLLIFTLSFVLLGLVPGL